MALRDQVFAKIEARMDERGYSDRVEAVDQFRELWYAAVGTLVLDGELSAAELAALNEDPDEPPAAPGGCSCCGSAGSWSLLVGGCYWMWLTCTGCGEVTTHPRPESGPLSVSVAGSVIFARRLSLPAGFRFLGRVVAREVVARW